MGQILSDAMEAQLEGTFQDVKGGLAFLESKGLVPKPALEIG
jgi:hypothetical protein